VSGGADGRDTLSPVGPFLIWQQAHPIYLAELLRRGSGPGSALVPCEGVAVAAPIRQGRLDRAEPGRTRRTGLADT
jgi:hypothetical protein